MTLTQLAQALYAQRVAERGPRWDQLGDVTRGVWLERAAQEMFG